MGSTRAYLGRIAGMLNHAFKERTVLDITPSRGLFNNTLREKKVRIGRNEEAITKVEQKSHTSPSLFQASLVRHIALRNGYMFIMKTIRNVSVPT